MERPPEKQPEENTQLVAIGTYQRVGRAHEHGLVILAMGIPYWLMPLEEGGYDLFVEKKHAEGVIEQLKRSDRENRYWPPRPDILPSAPGTGWSIAFYLLLIWGIFFAQTPEILGVGSASEEAIRSGEWWRTITALTLHADVGHLIGNSLGGLLFFSFVFRFLGHGIGWFFILLSGITGNLLNAWIYAGSGHNSIGASTAVFGGLGIVVGFRLLRQFRLTGWQWPRELLIPVIGGLVLLGFLGTGGERTDILAHAWGFLTGATLGSLVSLTIPKIAETRFSIQKTFAWLTVAIVIGAWTLALR